MNYKLVLIFGLFFVFNFSYSQNNDVARISISAYIPDFQSNVSQSVRTDLKAKLDRIITSSGLGKSGNNRFILTAKINELTKDVQPTTPISYLYNLEVILMLGDAVQGTLFSTHSIEVKGNGKSESQAYMNALSKIKSNSPEYTEFIDKGKLKIIEYYNSQCDFIIKDAQTLAGTKSYDEAIYTLASVPEVCKDCYNKCLDKIVDVYKAKVENECQQNIAQAKTLIAKDNYNDAASMLSTITPDMQCYSQAELVIKDIKDHRCAVALGEAKGYWVSHDVSSTSMALSSIPSDSKCYAEAMVLAKEVEKYVKETEKRDFEVMKQEMKNEQESKMATIKAARDIGVAYGSNQPKTITTYNIRGWW
jgi:hypothetical protein